MLAVSASTILFLSKVAKAVTTTYYVDCNAANDLGAGTSAGTAWKTIAKVNATLTGDQSDTSVLFNRGCTWREQLTVPGSGTSGHPFIFGAYGNSGDPKPVITGANLITSWTSDYNPANAGEIFSDGFESNDLTAWTGSTVDAGNTLAAQGTTKIAGNYTAKATFDGTHVKGYVYKTITTASDVYVDGKFQIDTYMFGTNYQHAYVINVLNTATKTMWVSIYRGAGASDYRIAAYVQHSGGVLSLYTGVVNQVALNTPIEIQVHYKSDASVGGGQIWVNGTSVASDFTRNTSANTVNRVETGNTSFSTVAPSAGSSIYFDAVGVGTSYIGPESGIQNVWNATVTTSPGYVLFNGTAGTNVGAKASVTSVNKWYWASNILSVYSTSNPATAFTSPGIESPIRAQAIHTNAKSYLSFQNLSLNMTTGSTFYGGASGGNNSISGVDVNRGGGSGFGLVWNGTNTIDSSTVDSNHSSECFGFSSTGTYNVSNSTANDCGYVAFATHNSVVLNATNDKASNSYTAGPDAQGFAFHDTSTANLNYCIATGIWLSGFVAVGSASGHIYNSVAYSNNRIANASFGGISIASSGNWDIKNNILVNNTRNILVTAGHGTITSDNNLFYDSGAATWQWNGTDYTTFADWKTNSGQDANSLNSDPLFTNAFGNDFTLQSSSPAINAGANLELTTDYAGNPVPSGNLPDIGAYEYQDVSAPTGGSFTINNNASVTNTPSATLNIVCPTDSWTPVEMSYGDSLNPTNWETCAISKAWTLPSGDGTKTVHMRFRDGGQNTTSDTTDTILLDTTGPTGSITNDSGTPTNDPTPTFNLTIADSGVGATGAQMRFSGNNSTWSSWEVYAATKTNFNINTGEGCANADGTKKIYVQFKDSLGNIGSAYDTGNFTLDTTASNAALSNTPATHGIYTSSTSADITVGGTDVISYKYQLDGGSYGDETPIATHLTLSDLAEENHTLHVIGKDSVGNWQSEAGATSYSWMIDTHAPERSVIAPSGELSSGTTSTTLTLTTSEVATCNYDTTSKNYGDMNNSFTTVDGLSHSASVSGLINGISYRYYIHCQDTAQNTNDTDSLISFSVAAKLSSNNTSTESTTSTDTPTDTNKNLNIHSVKASSTLDTITIIWKTDHNVKSTLRYGTNKNLTTKKKDMQKEKTHRVILTDLTPNTTYYFRIKTTDGNDNEDSSNIHSIATQTVAVSQSQSNANVSENETSTQNRKPKENTQTDVSSGNPAPTVCSYTVASGDTLWSIAKKVYKDSTAYILIIDKNKEKYPNITSKLSIGQELTFGCNDTQSPQNTENKVILDNANKQSQSSVQSQSQTETKTFKWWDPFTWF